MAAHTVTVNVQNNGEAVQKLSGDSAGKLYVMPKVDTIEPLVGSWAGGSILKLMGNGLNPDDGIVTVNFGEPPFAKACAIVEVTSTVIACRVPDFRDQKSGDEKVELAFGCGRHGFQADPGQFPPQPIHSLHTLRRDPDHAVHPANVRTGRLKQHHQIVK